MPIAAGQRPSFAGYGIGDGSARRPTLDASQATARAIARHGLSALKTSPKIGLTTASPTQNSTKMTVGARLFVVVCDPSKPA